MKIVNEHLQYPETKLMPPNIKGYLHIAVEVDSNRLPFYLFKSRKKRNLIKQAKELLRKIDRLAGVDASYLFSAMLRPPARQVYLNSVKDKIHIAKFDIAILIETESLSTAKTLRELALIRQLISLLKANALSTHVTVMGNARRIAEVDKSRDGVFLFNYFYAEDRSQLIPVWEYTAAWFVANTGLDNSTLLMPAENDDSDYGVINHCRWDKLSQLLPNLIFRKTIRSYVADNFSANKIAAMPILYRLVS